MSPLRPPPRSWTVDEQRKLDDLVRAGKTVPEIATALQRTRHAVYGRLHRLEVKRILPGTLKVTAKAQTEPTQIFDVVSE